MIELIDSMSWLCVNVLHKNTAGGADLLPPPSWCHGGTAIQHYIVMMRSELAYKFIQLREKKEKR